MFDLHYTEVMGIAAFSICAFFSFIVAFRIQVSRIWLFSGIAFALLVIEVAIGTRYEFLALVRNQLKANESYGLRHGWQIGFFFVLAMLMFTSVLSAVRQKRNGALSALLVLTLVFAIETISWHVVDAVLYRDIGPIKLIGVLWIAASIWFLFSATKALRASE